MAAGVSVAGVLLVVDAARRATRGVPIGRRGNVSGVANTGSPTRAVASTGAGVSGIATSWGSQSAALIASALPTASAGLSARAPSGCRAREGGDARLAMTRSVKPGCGTPRIGAITRPVNISSVACDAIDLVLAPVHTRTSSSRSSLPLTMRRASDTRHLMVPTGAPRISAISS